MLDNFAYEIYNNLNDKQKGGGEDVGSAYGFSAKRYNQIIVFSDSQDFEESVSANSNLEAIIGDDENTLNEFPGVYIAGIIAEAN